MVDGNVATAGCYGGNDSLLFFFLLLVILFCYPIFGYKC